MNHLKITHYKIFIITN